MPFSWPAVMVISISQSDQNILSRLKVS